ncbi:HU family DNA-binding protein [Cereibacter changlensis]|nr:HU family DNA-binding protein [Cereibacter changlensis]PZX54230.1 DNA-binding protein [Cereibacter changlensis]
MTSKETSGTDKPSAPKKRRTPAAAPSGETAAAPAGAVLATVKKKDLLERVAQATGADHKQVRDIVEATLNALSEALSKGEELNLPPFGKLKVNRQHERAVGEMMTLKLRRGAGPAAEGKSTSKRKLAKEPLAEVED